MGSGDIDCITINKHANYLNFPMRKTAVIFLAAAKQAARKTLIAARKRGINIVHSSTARR